MANVAETLLRIQGEKSPFIGMLEGFAGGFSKAQDNSLQRAQIIMQMEQQRAQMEQQRAQQQRMEEQDRMIRQQMEQQTQQALNATGQTQNVFPTQKLKMGITTNDKGYLTPKWETVEPKIPNTLDEIAAQQVREGKMTLEQAYEKKNKGNGNGITPSLAYQMQKDAEKRLMDEKGRVVPGYKQTGKVAVDDIEARKTREQVSEFESFKEALTSYKGLIEKYGTTEPTDRNVQGQLSAYAKNLQLKIKNLAQLGVLSASDVPFIEEQIPGPGAFKTQSGMLGALNTAEKLMSTALEKSLKTRGYEKENSGAGGGSGGSVPQVGGTFNGEKVLKVEKI